MNPLRGILYKILSVAFFVTMAACIKAASEQVPPGQAVFFRSLFALPVLVAWLWWRNELKNGFRTKNPMNHVWRGLVGTAAMGLNFWALSMLPLPEVTSIGYAAPLFIVIFAAMFLGEEVRLFRLSVVLIGLIGVLIILAPRLTAFEDGMMTDRQTLGAMAALMSATCAALAHVFIRKMVATEQTSAIVFWFSITSGGIALLTLPFGWVWPDPIVLALLVISGLLGGAGQILLTLSFRYAQASVVAPFQYVSIIFALLYGYLLFDELPTRSMLVGVAIVILAGSVIIWRERQLGLQRGKAAPGRTPEG